MKKPPDDVLFCIIWEVFIILIQCTASSDIVQRISGNPVYMHLEMEMRPAASPCAAYIRNMLALVYLFACPDKQPAAVRVIGLYPMAVVYNNEISK